MPGDSVWTKKGSRSGYTGVGWRVRGETGERTLEIGFQIFEVVFVDWDSLKLDYMGNSVI